MKRYLVLFLALICALSLCALPAAAEETTGMDKIFEGATSALDTFYTLDGSYMATKIGQMLYSWEEMDANQYAPKVMAADEVEAVLYQYFAPTDDQLQQFRRELGYDAAAGTYSILAWGGFGGIMSPRQYMGYSKDGDIYSIYWQTIDYAFLSDALPEGTNEWEYTASLGDPATIEYEGHTYYSGPEGYYYIVALLESGNVYTAEYNDGIVRLLGAGTFTAEDIPVFQQIPENSGVTIDMGDAFDAGTKVTVSTDCSQELAESAAAALEQVAQNFMVYDFTAEKNGEAVQPNGTLRVTFDLPENFSTDVSVYYLDSEGNIEQQPTTVDAENRTVTAELSHFSCYLLADNATKPEETEPKQTEPDGTEPAGDPTEGTDATGGNEDIGKTEPSGNDWILPVIIAAAVVIAALAVFLILRKKSGK